MVINIPEVKKRSFNCPRCSVLAMQRWASLDHRNVKTGYLSSTCDHCHKISIWNQEEKLIDPIITAAPHANEDMSEPVKKSYDEAGKLLPHSPPAAAAFLRLAIQNLVNELGEKGNLNTAIGNLVEKGLPLEIQRALDIVRVTGNDAVHPGEIDLTDDYDTAYKLFELVNFIIEHFISRPKSINEMYLSLPEGKRLQIEKRDQDTASISTT